MNRFHDLETKAQMNSLTIGAIEEIMGDLSTPAPSKLVGIARWLRELDLAWNAKKAPLPEGATEEISQTKCSINLELVEPLVDFPLTKRGPNCEICKCFNCSELTVCHIIKPSTMRHCERFCDGKRPILTCKIFDKENYEPEEIKKPDGCEICKWVVVCKGSCELGIMTEYVFEKKEENTCE